jgi:hypothetical protein
VLETGENDRRAVFVSRKHSIYTTVVAARADAAAPKDGLDFQLCHFGLVPHAIASFHD